MSTLDTPLDPPAGWQRDHVDQYVASAGEQGHFWNGVPTLLLTTTGRRSGQARRTPLIYGTDGDRYLVVASVGGADTPPAWYVNLVADPRVRLQIGAEVFDAVARDATPEEKPALWKTMTSIWPAYDAYQAKTARQIPVIILERVP